MGSTSIESEQLQAFQASTWQETGTLEALGGHGVRAIAVDLPGHGVTGGQALPPNSRAAFLQDLLKALHVRQPLVLITPSMSGSYILPWLADHAAELTAWVAVAPAGLKQWVPQGVLEAASKEAKLKVLAIYGEKDGMRPDFTLIEDALPRAQFLLIPAAGHACYKDAPKLFNRELLRFLDNEVAG
ncbi:hypothetical protein CHLNCDRAFT_134030 [Chlorella variabilis]|uniref:Serine aminopeptidase S33 domain-containing protein n=1 Tax=Chlorella variabilis TaxID=554065 RepID=E1ZEU3_CHLVA|nr:hypothetical protein CHLNCDRAFT_134030 [Chlorella variabilis]EFN55558.1 hypothetical protein CHLNCDRAFT_134030 [Chlorella variabilis]|eukprot:XP_005847660.1 hypothetical protein CHLNCDRAFT_134030 [Chlorella variabilis]